MRNEAYVIRCPHCKRVEQSFYPLTKFGEKVLVENEYLYQNCVSCTEMGMEIQEHEKQTRILDAKSSLGDLEIEKLWETFGDTPIDEDENIDEDFHFWEKGTNRETIWRWFDQSHTKGVGYLMYERNK